MDYLPIFINLRGQACWVVGGGAVAARKADLLAQAGALVMVISPEINGEIANLVKTKRYLWVQQHFDTAMAFALPRPRLIIAATDCSETNQTAYRWGEANGALVNVTDQTELCRFILPAIVDRSPLIVAVSTGGRSPVLARVMKTKLEGWIPAGLGRLTDLLGRLRDQVKKRIPNIEGRKDFWEQVLTPAWIEKAMHGSEQRMGLSNAWKLLFCHN